MIGCWQDIFSDTMRGFNFLEVVRDAWEGVSISVRGNPTAMRSFDKSICARMRDECIVG